MSSVSLAIGILVPSNDARLLSAQASGVGTAAASPWVIGIYRASIPVLPSIANVVVLTVATSSVSAFLYVGSRYLYALAQDEHAPRFLLWCSKR
jgi:yeast amino acid transporter